MTTDIVHQKGNFREFLSQPQNKFLWRQKITAKFANSKKEICQN